MELNNSLNNIMKNLHNVAIHEAGHAVADCVLGHGLTPQGIELSRFDDERFEGVVYANDSNPRDCIAATFAGPIAEYRATREMRNIETDVLNIARCCRELLGLKNTFVENECNYENVGDFFALVFSLTEHTDRVRALQDIEEYEETIEQVDGVRPLVDRTIVDLLWPLAQRGHEIINCNWPKVEAIATELYKTKKLSGDEVQSIMTSSAGPLVSSSA
jgi:hypothetical protein